MLIEALAPLQVKLPEKELRVEAGQTMNLPQQFAIKLLEKAPGKVRVLDPPILADLTRGARVIWESPLFGQCSGEIALLPENGWVVVHCHSVTGNVALVHLDWISSVNPR